MAGPTSSRRRRSYQILRLFFSLVLSFFFQYLRARLGGHSYDFFEDAEHNRERAIKIRTTALEMGGVLIKVGQFLSSRVDLLPTEYIEELVLLQDEVPSVPFEDIRVMVERELGAPLESLFGAFSQVPIAAASLGQVHRATLRTGETVAVKVQRPGIEEIVNADLASLRYIVRWLHRHTNIHRRVDLKQVLREFEDTLRMELDYLREGHHAERLSVSFHGVPEVAIPRIFWSHTTGRVVCMQFMPGTKVTDFLAVERQGIDRAEVAEILMRAYLKQVLEDGFFHADPHPGNIFVRPGPVVVLVDFGMVGEISPQMRENIRRAFLGVIRRDFDEVIVALERLGFIPRDADRHVLKRAIVWTVDTFYEMSFGELRSVDPRQVLDQLQDVFYTESFRIPANFAFLGRALGTLSGLCTALDPSFQFVSVAEPYARNLLQRRSGVFGTVEQIASEARSLATTAYSLPHLSRDMLTRVQAGEMGFRHELEEMARAMNFLEHAMRRIFYGMILSGILVAGAFIFPKHHEFLSLIAFGVTLFILLLLIFSVRRTRT
jgi:predicted unusual protein kinase regulating ubiquinone biosynthesis (AarF/ABC1/UbiB family)